MKMKLKNMRCALVSPLLLQRVQPGYVNCNRTDRIEDREDESEKKFKCIFIFFFSTASISRENTKGE